MILIFHCVSLLIRYIIKERRHRNALLKFQKIQQNIKDINSNSAPAYINAEQDLKFSPPVYLQRYDTIHDVLLEAPWRKHIKKIVEFGCAELKLFIYIKHLIGVTEIDFVDIDEQLLRNNLFRVGPYTIEYLIRRSDPLTVNVFAGSITDPDRRIVDADAVIGIEIIEHLYPDVLEAVPYTIFHCVQPIVTIFTTPNADFNELLPNLKGFRHNDHKFEWTREQFMAWATNITERFPQYFVSFHGIGHGPEGTKSLGCCSQMAVFVRKDVLDVSYVLPTTRCFCRGDMQSENKDENTNKKKRIYCPNCCPMQSYGICTYYSYAKHLEELKTESRDCRDPENLIFYKLLHTEDYPYEKDDRTSEQKILDELTYRIHRLGGTNDRYFRVDKLRSEIPIVALIYGGTDQFISEDEAQILLSSHGYKLEECITDEVEGKKQLCLIYEPEMEESSSSESEASGYESGHSRFLNEASLSDWDNDDSLIERDGQKAPNGGIFPEWLLQMLRTNFPVDGEVIPEGPHFFCQGDGLGVHPSIMGINVDDEDGDASSESTSSTNGSANLEETQIQNSMQDIVSLPDDNREVGGGSGGQTHDIIPLYGIQSDMGNSQLGVHNEESEEYFDTTDEVNLSPRKLL